MSCTSRLHCAYPRRLVLLACLLVVQLTGQPQAQGQAVDHEALTKQLALILSDEGDLRSSAIEFRRLAMTVDEPERQAGYFWGAAHQYQAVGDHGIADRLLDRAEDAWPAIEDHAMLLRADAASQQRNWSAAGFYWSALLRSTHEAEHEQYVRRRLAAVRLQEGRLEEARELLAHSTSNEEAGLQALNRYDRGRDKKPAVGGLLGMIPGMGYAYAGEYANAFRSLILNALFIYGMVDTAQNDHWGGFAVITFFEITWYTGSIYGGIDASHRYNQRRLHEAVRSIEGDAAFAPDWSTLPIVSISFTF